MSDNADKNKIKNDKRKERKKKTEEESKASSSNKISSDSENSQEISENEIKETNDTANQKFGDPHIDLSENLSQDSHSQDRKIIEKEDTKISDTNQNNVNQSNGNDIHQAAESEKSEKEVETNEKEKLDNSLTGKDEDTKQQMENTMDEDRIRNIKSYDIKQNENDEDTKPVKNEDQPIDNQNNENEINITNDLRHDRGASNHDGLTEGTIDSNVEAKNNGTEKSKEVVVLKDSNMDEKDHILHSVDVNNLNYEAKQDMQIGLNTSLEINSNGMQNQNIFSNENAKDAENEQDNSVPEEKLSLHVQNEQDNSAPEENVENNLVFVKRKLQLFSYYNSGEWDEKLENQKNNASQNYVILSIEEITDALQAADDYTNENINLIFSNYYLSNDNENPERVYLSHLTDTKFTYDGVLNKNFEKNIIGKNKFANGDIYIGNWKNDKKDGFGVYVYNSEGNDALSELFCGKFEDNGKKKEGFYFNSTGHQLPEERFSFDAFEGDFESNENLHQGTFISLNKDETKSYVYLGKFSENKKHDESGYYYLFNSRLLFIGKFDQDNITQGHLFELTPVKQIKSVVRYNSSTGKKEVASEVDMEEQINNANAFLSKIDPNKIITSAEEISQQCLRLEENWRDKKIKCDGDVELLSDNLEKLNETMTNSSIKL